MGFRKAKYKTNHKEHHTWGKKYWGPFTPKQSLFSHSLIFLFLVSPAQTFYWLAHSAPTVNQTWKCPAKESSNETGYQDKVVTRTFLCNYKSFSNNVLKRIQALKLVKYNTQISKKKILTRKIYFVNNWSYKIYL